MREISRVWFQQDGAGSHTARATRRHLNDIFGNRTIGKYLDINFPPRSPDLSPLDFFFWGYIKNEVYRHVPFASMHDMQIKIIEACDNFRQLATFEETLDAVFRCLKHRLTNCNVQNGHFTELRVF